MVMVIGLRRAPPAGSIWGVRRIESNYRMNRIIELEIEESNYRRIESNYRTESNYRIGVCSGIWDALCPTNTRGPLATPSLP